MCEGERGAPRGGGKQRADHIVDVGADVASGRELGRIGLCKGDAEQPRERTHEVRLSTARRAHEEDVWFDVVDLGQRGSVEAATCCGAMGSRGAHSTG